MKHGWFCKRRSLTRLTKVPSHPLTWNQYIVVEEDSFGNHNIVSGPNEKYANVPGVLLSLLENRETKRSIK